MIEEGITKMFHVVYISPSHSLSLASGVMLSLILAPTQQQHLTFNYIFLHILGLDILCRCVCTSYVTDR